MKVRVDLMTRVRRDVADEEAVGEERENKRSRSIGVWATDVERE